MAALDADARRVLRGMAAAGGPTLDQLPPPQARLAANAVFFALQAKHKAPLAQLHELQADTAAGSLALRIYRPVAGAVLPALVYFHGGGFTIGDLELYDQFCRLLATASGCAVIAVDYRLAPEHRFPAAVDDAIAATRWIAGHAQALGIDAGRLAVGGDSAGGNLAAVVALHARDHGGPALAHQLLIYPVTAIDTGTDSFRRCSEGHFLTAALLQYFVGHYLDPAGGAPDWRVVPQHAARHAGLPPATVLVCGFDPLRDEGVAYAQTLQQAGVATQLIEYASQIHGFLLMDGAVAEATDAIESLGAALRRALG